MVLAAAGLLAVAGPASAAGAVRYVALGDSYSSGLGAGAMIGSSGSCDRSSDAFPQLWANAHHPASYASVACSGATTGTVIASQLSALSTSTTLVSITIGGNDVGLFGLVTSCLGRGFSSSRCANTAPPPDFAALKSRLIALYAAIHARAPQARIIVFGYPLALPPTAPRGCAGLYQPGTPIGIDPRDVPYFYKLLTTLNDTVHQAAQASASATFVSPDLIFAGHDVCSPSSYFFPLDYFKAAETLHPNAQGHAELASLLHRAAGPPPD